MWWWLLAWAAVMAAPWLAVWVMHLLKVPTPTPTYEDLHWDDLH